jgi:hypothetical protein
MAADIIPIVSRQAPHFQVEIDCIGCGQSVYAPVHFGNKRLCFLCQRLGVQEHLELMAVLKEALIGPLR